jgi:hypothetical protein
MRIIQIGLLVGLCFLWSCAATGAKNSIALAERPHICERQLTVGYFGRDRTDKVLGDSVEDSIGYWTNAMDGLQKFLYVGRVTRGQRVDVTVEFVPTNDLWRDDGEGRLMHSVGVSVLRVVPYESCIRGGAIHVDRRYLTDPARLGTILRHELGFLLGVGKSTDPTDVMHPSVEGADFEHPKTTKKATIESLKWIYRVRGEQEND